MVEGFGGGAVAEDSAGSGVEFVGDGVEVGLGVHGQVGALGQVVADQAVDASMSSVERVPGDVVLPGRVIGGHCLVDDVDEVALEDPACSA